MWHPYQYKKGKLKLMKDLKHGNAHLRHSLIDIEQIDNLGKVYHQRKSYYNIEQKQVDHTTAADTAQDESIPFHLTPEEKIIQYRKALQASKLKDKYKSLFKQQEPRRYKLRNPLIHKMLEEFKQKYHGQEPNTQKDELKQSEKQLEHVKINSQRKMQYSEESAKVGRARFISLETSLPKEKDVFPTYQEHIQSKFSHNEVKPPGINLSVLQTAIDNFLLPRATQAHQSNKSQPRSQECLPMAQKVKSHEQTFTRSEEYSQVVISTMSGFHESKKSKRQEYSDMISFLKHDRPLTSDIRRRNYDIVGVKHLNQMRKYRCSSEQERVSIRQRNYLFYMELIKIVEKVNEELIPTSLKLIEQMRAILESDYHIKRKDMQLILNQLKNQPQDQQIAQIMSRIEGYLGYPLE